MTHKELASIYAAGAFFVLGCVVAVVVVKLIIAAFGG